MRDSTLVATVLGLLLAVLLLASPAEASSFDLARVADLNTAIPNGTGNFTDVYFPALGGSTVAFGGIGNSGQQGIYLFGGSTLARVADTNTAIPNGTGNFTAVINHALSGGTVAFEGSGSSGQWGIYLFDGSTLGRVADTNTAIPNGTGNFTTSFGFGSLELSGGTVAFLGEGTSGQRGIYLFDGSTLGRVADTNTAIPNGAGNFTSVANPALSGGNVAFGGLGSSGQRGIYLFDGSTLGRVADTNTAIPNGTGNFTFTFLFPAQLSGGNVAFLGYEPFSQQQGIYLFGGSTLARVADLKTAIPNGTGNFISLGSFQLSGGTVAFRGEGTSGQQGIYLFDGSMLGRVADTNTAIPNGTGNFTSFGSLQLSGGTVAFEGFGSSGQQGIYLFDGSMLGRVADLNTAVPNGTGNFIRFGSAELSGGTVAFEGLGSSGQQGIYLATPGTTTLSRAKVWIGLKNSDDVGLRLDLKAEVFVNSASGSPIATGQLDNVSGGGSGFKHARLDPIPLTLISGPVSVAAGDQLLLRVSVRRTCARGGHSTGTVRLWYNGKAIDSGATRDAGSRFDATIEGSTDNYYLRTGFALSTIAGTSRTSIDRFVDSKVACPGRPFTSFGTWSISLP